MLYTGALRISLQGCYRW